MVPIAHRPGSLPLLGLAISGVGLRTNPGDHERWQALPDIPLFAMPPEIKDHVMIGPARSYDDDMPAAGRIANAPAPKAELLAITGAWGQTASDVLGRIAVPVHYRQAEFDRLWIVREDEVRGFAAALSNSPMVDARMVNGTGHCIDHHRFGPALHLQQLGFTLGCASGDHNFAK
jgi:pimeloyl-ACP methyl ester carboxylesterase